MSVKYILRPNLELLKFLISFLGEQDLLEGLGFENYSLPCIIYEFYYENNCSISVIHY